MSQNYFAKRINRLVHRQFVLTKKEVAIAKSLRTFFKNYEILETLYFKQWKELNNLKKRILINEGNNVKLKNVLHEKETQLQAIKEDIVKLRQTVEQRIDNQLEARQIAIEQKDRIYCLKMSTNILINLNKLPELIQGVALCEKQASTVWRPFSIDPMRHTQDEVQQIIWNEIENHDVYYGEWKNLFFSNLQNHPEELPSESDADAEMALG